MLSLRRQYLSNVAAVSRQRDELQATLQQVTTFCCHRQSTRRRTSNCRLCFS